MERAPSAGKPRVFRGLLGMAEGISPSRFPRHWPPGGRHKGRSGPAGKRREIFFRALKEVPLAAGPGLGWSPRGRKFPGPVACVTAGWDGGADRWAARRPRGRALGGAGCRWPGCLQGGAGGGSIRGRGGGGAEGCEAGALAASRLGAREED